MLKEQFLSVCNKELATHVREAKNQNLKDVLETAERFIEARGWNFNQSIAKDKTPQLTRANTQESAGPTLNSQSVKGKFCRFCKTVGHLEEECRKKRCQACMFQMWLQ